MSSQASPERAASSAASIYEQSSFDNAPPVKIVRLLYQGAIRFIDSAAACDPHAAGSRFQLFVARAEDIVIELRVSIEPAPTPELAASLTDLYLFVEQALRKARHEKSIEPLAEARGVLAKLLEAWTAIETGRA